MGGPRQSQAVHRHGGRNRMPNRTPHDVLQMIEEHGIQMVDLKFTDLPGAWQHFSLPAGKLAEDDFVDGLGFDGSSIRGFQVINESDMLVVPDAATAFVDPACTVPTLSLICDIRDPLTGRAYPRDPRYIARKAEQC